MIEEPGTRLPTGVPNTRLIPAFEYVGQSTYWASQNKPKPADVLQEMVDKLYLRQLTAWGRRVPDGGMEPIPGNYWAALKLNPGTGNAHTDDGTSIFFGIQFDQDHLYQVWPPSRV